MNRRTFARGLLLSPLAAKGFAYIPAATSARVTIDPRQELGTIDRKIYGHFLEHVERVVYGGIFDPDSKLSDASGIRQDVVAAIKEMGGARVLRWPGGNFASYYHWKDGIGPRAQRPRRYDVTWKQWESNGYGTDEYLQTCSEVGCEPFITVNMGDGTVREACEWVEYTRLEKREPAVKIWGLGNEHYGPWQVGHYSPQEYGRKAQQFGHFMRAVSPDLRFVGVGHWTPEWNQGVLGECGEYLDWLTVHLYSHRFFLNGENDFDSSVAASAFFEKTLSDVAGQLDEYERKSKRSQPISLCLEEWNGRHLKKEAGKKGDGTLFREDPRNIVDALFVAGVFHACQRMASRVTMTNYVFLLNAHGPLMVYPEGVVKTALYDVFRLYSTLTQDISVAAETSAESLSTSVHQSGPDVNVTTSRIESVASRSVDGKKMTVSLINRYPDQSSRVSVNLKNARLGPKYRMHQMTAPSLTAINTLSQPNTVRSHSSEHTIDGELSVLLPAASITHLELTLENY